MNENTDTSKTGKKLKPPQTIRAAVNRLIDEMPLKDKVQLAHMQQEELVNLRHTLGAWIRNNFGLWEANDSLTWECVRYHGHSFMHIDEDEAPMIIIYELWKQLKDTHRLRLVTGKGPHDAR